jgi:hypothetical protein
MYTELFTMCMHKGNDETHFVLTCILAVRERDFKLHLTTLIKLGWSGKATRSTLDDCLESSRCENQLYDQI